MTWEGSDFGLDPFGLENFRSPALGVMYLLKFSWLHMGKESVTQDIKVSYMNTNNKYGILLQYIHRSLQFNHNAPNALYLYPRVTQILHTDRGYYDIVTRLLVSNG